MVPFLLYYDNPQNPVLMIKPPYYLFWILPGLDPAGEQQIFVQATLQAHKKYHGLFPGPES